MSFSSVKRNTKVLGMSLAVAAAMSVCQSSSAVIYQFGGAVDNAFLTSGNWTTPPSVPSALVPGAGDRALINDARVVSYATSATTTLGSLIVGADWPVTGSGIGTPGTLNMTAGKFIVTGGGDSFQLGRASGAGDGTMNMSNNAILEIGGSDPIVGTRDNAVLDLAGSSQVIPTNVGGTYWRLGNYGPSAGEEGNGLLNVHDNASFSANVIFIGDNDATGELRVSDHGSVLLTGNIVPRPSGFQAQGSATVRMTGSTATLSAYNLESESLAGEVPTLYRFDADASGVSPIKLVDAINIGNNALEVNLGGLVIPPAGTLLLFDGDQALVGSRIFGSFSSLTVDGILNPAAYSVLYDQPTGNISLQAVPEPTMLSGLAAAGLFMIRRRRA
jgi:hypothetical protein